MFTTVGSKIWLRNVPRLYCTVHTVPLACWRISPGGPLLLLTGQTLCSSLRRPSGDIPTLCKCTNESRERCTQPGSALADSHLLKRRTRRPICSSSSGFHVVSFP